jgi:hypothetical protein
LHEEPNGGFLGAKDGLEARATLPADRCHFDDIAVLIDRHHGDDAAVGEKYIFERAIGVQLAFPAFVACGTSINRPFLTS